MKMYIYSALLSGLRSRAFHAIFILTIFLMGLVWLSAHFSARHPQTLALDLGLSCIRLVLITMGLFWIQELFARDVEQKTIIFTLAYPTPRSHYLFGRFLGLAVLLLLAMSMMGFILWLMISNVFAFYPQSTPVHLGVAYIMTLLYQWCAIITIMAFAMCMATFSTVPMLTFILGIGFAIGASMIGPTLDYIVVEAPKHYASITPFIEKFFWLLPDLSRLDIRDWALYGQAPDSGLMLYSLLMAFSYSVVLLLLANLKFSSREFT